MMQNKGKQYYALKLRIYPNESQKIFLNESFGAYRFAYNKVLDYRKTSWEENKLKTSDYDAIKHLVNLKSEFVWLKQYDAQMLQKAVMNMNSAYKNFFKLHKGYPKFKSAKNELRFTTDKGFKIDLETNTLKIPKLKSFIKIRSDKRRPAGKPKSITISKTKTDKYFVSILYEQQCEFEYKKLDSNKACGIDFGLKTFLNLSDCSKIDAPLFYKKSFKKLKRQQRILSRRKKGSAKRAKAKLKVAKIHEKIVNQRKYWAENTALKLVQKFDYICIEDLNIKAMQKLWGRKISDLGWYTFTQILSNMCIKHKKVLHKIDRFAATSKICNICGNKTELKLSDRKWICNHCGAQHDRDINAAINILKIGRSNLLLGRNAPEITPPENQKSGNNSIITGVR